jgi:hypothetical protein
MGFFRFIILNDRYKPYFLKIRNPIYKHIWQSNTFFKKREKAPYNMVSTSITLRKQIVLQNHYLLSNKPKSEREAKPPNQQKKEII